MKFLETVKRLVFGSPSPYHEFAGVSSQAFYVDDSLAARAWPLRKTECTRCGQPRMMSMFVDPTRVRDLGCIGRRES